MVATTRPCANLWLIHAYPICIHMCHGQNLNIHISPIHVHLNPHEIHLNPHEIHLSPHEIHLNLHEISGATPILVLKQNISIGSTELRRCRVMRVASWQVHKPNPDGGKVIILLRLLDEVSVRVSFNSRDFQGDRPL